MRARTVNTMVLAAAAAAANGKKCTRVGRVNEAEILSYLLVVLLATTDRSNETMHVSRSHS